MENIITNPGLQHLVENIFLDLNYENLKKCQLINHQATNQLLENPMFWIKKCIRNGFLVSEECLNDWTNAIQSARRKSDKEEKHIVAYLNWNLSTKERKENRKIVDHSVNDSADNDSDNSDDNDSNNSGEKLYCWFKNSNGQTHSK